jgi:hypothetical protein
LVALDTPEGEKLLAESNARVDFFRLMDSFVTQERSSDCGIASAVAVLNALPIAAPDTEVGKQYTQTNFFGEAARKVYPPESAAKGGLTIDQLADLLQTHPVHAEVVHASDLSLDEMRARLAKNLATADDYVIVNYDRGGVGQETMGHISPLGAYHAASDRFLLLDVARYKYPPVWVKADALFAAMRTNDIVSGKSRGFLTITAAKEAPGPTGAGKKARSPLVLLGGIVGAAFLVGLGSGFGIARVTSKRRATRS